VYEVTLMLLRFCSSANPPFISVGSFPTIGSLNFVDARGLSLLDLRGVDKEDLDLVSDLSGYDIIHFEQYQLGFNPLESINLESLRLQYGQYCSLRDSICV
jgi:hypothetical protein